jgi:hypothetical protein
VADFILTLSVVNASGLTKSVTSHLRSLRYCPLPASPLDPSPQSRTILSRLRRTRHLLCHYPRRSQICVEACRREISSKSYRRTIGQHKCYPLLSIFMLSGPAFVPTMPEIHGPRHRNRVTMRTCYAGTNWIFTLRPRDRAARFNVASVTDVFSGSSSR